MTLILLQEAALEHQITHLQEKLNEVESMCQYCSAKMDAHIGQLQHLKVI